MKVFSSKSRRVPVPPTSKNGKLSCQPVWGVAGAEVASLPSASLPHCLVVAQKLLFAHLLVLSLTEDWFVPIPLCPWLFSIPPLLLSLIEMCYLWDHFDKTHVGTITWSFFISRKTLPYQSVIYWQLQNQLLGLCSMPFNVWSDHLLTLNCIWSCVKSIKPKDDVCHFFHLCSAQKGDTEHLWHTDIQLKVAIQSQTSIQIQSFLVSGSQIISAVLSW